MIMSSSLIMIKVNNYLNFGELQEDLFFEEEKTFYSLSFESKQKDVGEIHWTTSYQFGKMNIVYFLRQENFFYLFTSTPEHFNILKKILTHLFQGEINIELLKVPRKSKFIGVDDNRVCDIKYDENFGFSANLKIENWSSLLKFYSNGLITYKMNDNRQLIDEIISICKALLDGVVKQNE